MTRPLARKGYASFDVGAPVKPHWPRGKWVALTLVLLAGLLWLGASCTGREDAPRAVESGPVDAPVRSAHGPATIVDGVPTGYTQDPEGASTAAVNTIQALNEASRGRVSMAVVESTRIAAQPSQTIAEIVADGKLPPRANPSKLNVHPAAVTVTSYSDTAAEVSVWEVVVSQSRFNELSPIGVNVYWTTEVVSLKWEGDDWRVMDKVFKPGPSPNDPAVTAPPEGSALAGDVQQGFYSMYVN